MRIGLFIASLLCLANLVQAKTDKAKVEDLTTFPKNVSLPLAVNVALAVNQVAKFSEEESVFTGQISLRLRWHDPRLRFDTKVVSSSHQKFSGADAQRKLAAIWHPHIIIENLAQEPTQNDFGLVISAEGGIELFQQVEGQFKTTLNLQAFPFDTQYLPIRLVSSQYDTQQLILTQAQEDLDFASLPEENPLLRWHFGAMEFTFSEFRRWDGNLFAQSEGRLVVQRNFHGYIPTLFMPMLLILFSSFVLALCLKQETLKGRITVINSSLLGLVTLVFTISLRYPFLEVDSVVMQMFWTSFIFLWLILLVVITTLNPALESYWRDSYLIAELNVFFIWSIPLILAVILTRMMLLALV